MDSRPDLRRGHAVVLEAERDVVSSARHDELRLRVLKHESGLAAHVELALLFAGACVKQTCERLKERALPGARRTY